MKTLKSSSDSGFTVSQRAPLELLLEKRRRPQPRRDSQIALQIQSLQSQPIVRRTECQAAAKTRGEIEAEVCVGISRIQQNMLGKGPRDIRTHLLSDLLLVRLIGVLTPAERKLVDALDGHKGCHLVKQVRTQLIEATWPVMQALIADVTGVEPISLHHDLSTVTEEEVFVFTLPEPPCFRAVADKRDCLGTTDDNPDFRYGIEDLTSCTGIGAACANPSAHPGAARPHLIGAVFKCNCITQMPPCWFVSQKS